MRLFTHVLAALLVALVSTSLLPTLTGRLPAPNLILVAVGVFALRNNPLGSLIWAGVGGLILDFSSGSRSYYLLTLMVLAIATNFFVERLNLRPSLSLAALVGFAYSLLIVGLELIMSQVAPSWLAVMAVAGNLVVFLIGYGILSTFRPQNRHTIELR